MTGADRTPLADQGVSRRLLTIGGCDRFLLAMVTAVSPVLFLRYGASSTVVGFGNALQYSSWVFFGLIAGGLADVYDRATLISISMWIRLSVVCVAILLTLTGGMSIGWAIGIISVLAASVVFTDTALNASLPYLFARDALVVANSQLSVVQSVAAVVAPVAATLALVAGSAWLFVLLAIPSLITVAALRWSTPSAFGTRGSGKFGDVSLLAGLRALLRSRLLRTLLLGVSLLNVLSGAFLTILPILVIHERGVPASAFGVALAVKAAALITANIVIARVVAQGREIFRTLLRLSFLMRVISFALVGIFPSYAILLIAMVIGGIGTSAWNVPASTMALEASRGNGAASKISSFKTAAAVWTPLGAGLGGLASVWSASGACLIMSGIAAAASVIFYVTIVRSALHGSDEPLGAL